MFLAIFKRSWRRYLLKNDDMVHINIFVEENTDNLVMRRLESNNLTAGQLPDNLFDFLNSAMYKRTSLKSLKNYF